MHPYILRVITLLITASLALPQLAVGQTPYEAAYQEKAKAITHDRGSKLKGYNILPNTGQPIQVNLTDTLTYGAHRAVATEGRSLSVAYTGNVSSPWQSKIFFDRAPQGLSDFIYSTAFERRALSPSTALFYNTRTPFTFVHYRKNFEDDMLEEILQGTLSFNLGKQINLGVSVDYAEADGYYSSSHSKHLGYRLFGSYQSDRYDLWASLSNDDQRQHESGGISNLDYILNPDNYSGGRVRTTSRDIPVLIPNAQLYNRVTMGLGFLSHRYKLGYASSQKLTDPKSKVERDSTYWVTLGSISHQLIYSKQSRYLRGNPGSELWQNLFGSPIANTRDSIITQTDPNTGTTESITQKIVSPTDRAQVTTLSNIVALSLHEGFRPWVKAGLSAYIRTDQSWYYNLSENLGTYEQIESDLSIYVGGVLGRTTGRGLNFALQGEVALTGRDLGAFTLQGKMHSRFTLGKKDFGLQAHAQLSNTPPSYFANHHHGTWHWWDKNYDFIRRLELGARVDLESWGSWAELRTASLQNHLYWERTGQIAQHSGLMQVTMLRLGHQHKLGVLAWDIQGAYQLSSLQDILPLPELSLRGDLFLDFYIAKVLRVQAGVEGYWHSAYYAPYYHPAVMQFVNQTESKIGGKAPLVNAYANFRHKNTRFYIKMFNIGESFLRTDRLTALNYVYNPQHLQVGVIVDLKY